MARTDLTVIYYTSNREHPEFEARICRSLRHTTRKLGLPIISVSQKPMDFGKNICVGDVGVSGYNTWRQYQIGVLEAKTRFVCNVESDFLPPREYFEFVPARDDMCYLAMPLYVLFVYGGKSRQFYPKPGGSEGAMLVGRECILGMLDRMFHPGITWSTELDQKIDLRSHGTHKDFMMSAPIVTFKTDHNMHRKSPIVRSRGTGTLPYWGNSHDLIAKYVQ